MRTQSPSATERTEGTSSVTTRTPEPSSVSCGALNASCAARASPAVARASRLAAAAAAAPAAAVAAVAADRRRRSRPQASSSRRFALDRGVVGEAQADPAALAVDLDHGDVDLLAGGEHVVDRVDPLAGLDVGDVQQAVGALDQLDEGAEGGRLHDLGGVVAVADLGLLGHRLDAGDAGFDQLAGRRVDPHRAVVLDVDLRLELLAEGADRFAAFADHGADLLRVDLDRLDPRRVLGELLARAVDRLGHLAEDELAALVGLLQRVARGSRR